MQIKHHFLREALDLLFYVLSKFLLLNNTILILLIVQAVFPVGHQVQDYICSAFQLQGLAHSQYTAHAKG